MTKEQSNGVPENLEQEKVHHLTERFIRTSRRGSSLWARRTNMHYLHLSHSGNFRALLDSIRQEETARRSSVWQG